ncbi:evolutionarily conserved signaling intermediate in Toll pathway, mitochondrial [Antennarius striatus]|uniref:evolutionarily conserved signaling intermediate in Toll pathway, mitochondrial n=1 Tax=Antennarius striatus TaxID=241820 RepID=UPI0035ADD2EE
MRCTSSLPKLLSLSVAVRSGWSASQYNGLVQSHFSSQTSVFYQGQQQVSRHLHHSPVFNKSHPHPTELTSKGDKKPDHFLFPHHDLFEKVDKEARTKATFNKVLEVFIKGDVRRRGHIEFIYAALRKMPEFGVERDLTIYNKLLDVFPKEVFVPRNFIQRMFNHYPRQQECGVQVLEQMENNGVTPNTETKLLLIQIFGKKSHPVKKYQRIMYWFPKFKHANPFPIPTQLSVDPVDVARFSLTRIANDLDSEITVYQFPSTDVTESGEEVTHPHIVGIQSPSQKELLAKHNPSRPVFVEGPFPLWLKKTCVYYYILRADPVPPDQKVEEPYDPQRSLGYPLQLDLNLELDFGEYVDFDVEDLDEGPVFAMCMTSQNDEATLNQWISGLQKNNPILNRVPTLFRLDASTNTQQWIADTPSENHRPHTEKEETT